MYHIRTATRKVLLENCSRVNKKITKAMNELEDKGFFIKVIRADDDAIHVELRQVPSYGRVDSFEAGFIKLAKVQYEDDTPDQAIAYRKQNYPDLINCNNSYIVHHSKILNLYRDRIRGVGVGALLYDVALELAGENGISPDRYHISNDSFQMYDYFYKNPSLYEKKYLDAFGETDPTEDDCAGESPYDYPMYDTKDGLSLSGSPLAYTYIKRDQSKSTIKCLDLLGLISGKY